MSIVNDKIHGIIGMGITRPMVDGEFIGSGQIIRHFVTKSGSVLCSVFVRSASGTVDISIKTSIKGDRAEELEIITFPTLSAPSSEILVKQAAVCLSIVTLVISHSDSCNLLVAAQGIEPGESSAKIIGAANLTTTQITATTTPQALVAVSAMDRESIIIKNYGGLNTLWISESAATCIPAGPAYPLEPGESLGIGLGAGQTVYGRSQAGTCDVRIIEAGA